MKWGDLRIGDRFGGESNTENSGYIWTYELPGFEEGRSKADAWELDKWKRAIVVHVGITVSTTCKAYGMFCVQPDGIRNYVLLLFSTLKSGSITKLCYSWPANRVGRHVVMTRVLLRFGSNMSLFLTGIHSNEEPPCNHPNTHTHTHIHIKSTPPTLSLYSSLQRIL